MENGETEFRVKLAGPNVDGAPAIATFKLPGVERAVKYGDDALVLFQRKTTNTNNNYSTTLTATVYDMTSPASPRKAGSILLPVEYLSYPRFSAGVSSYFPYWGDATDMVETDKGLVFLTSTWSNNATARKIIGLNLSNVDAPKLSEVVLTADADVTMLGLARDESAYGEPGGLYLSFSKKNGTKDREGTTFDLVKYSAQRFTWNATILTKGNTVNVPGKLVKSFVQGGQRKLLTHDRVFDVQKGGGFQESPRMAVLTLVNANAKLDDAYAFWGMDMRDLVIDDGRLYANLADRQTYSGWGGGIRPMGASKMMRYTPPASELRILSVGDKLSERYSENLGTDGIELMGVHNRKLFVSLAGDGVLVVDANNVEKPVARDFVRTLGWAWSVEVAGNDALIPSGHYGTYQLSLLGSKKLGQN